MKFIQLLATVALASGMRLSGVGTESYDTQFDTVKNKIDTRYSI